MSEIPRSLESQPSIQLFQVVQVPYRDGLRRCVVVQLFDDPDFTGTAEIVDEGTENERLGIPGTSSSETLLLTDEIWGRDHVIDSMTATYGDMPGMRERVEKILDL